MTILTIACVLILASIANCQDSEAFRADLDAVQNSMHRGGWKSARKKLDEILATYEKKPFVIARRQELIELYRRCDFASNLAAPKPADLITGKLLAYDERRGRIKLDYDVSNIGDFTKIGSFLHHPLKFAGPYSIEISGKAYGEKSGVQLLVDNLEGHAWRALFGVAETGGRFLHADLSTIEGKAVTVKESRKSTLEAGKPFKVRVQVTDNKIALYNGSKLSVDTKRNGEFGTFAFLEAPFERIRIEGKPEPSWLQGLMDRAIQEQREAFDNAWVASEHLPQWLIDPRGRTKVEELSILPTAVSQAQSRFLELVETYLADGKAAEGLTWVRQANDSMLPKVVRDTYELLFLRALGEYEPAIALAARILKEHPTFTYGQIVQASLLFDVGKPDAAREAFAALLSAHPNAPLVYEAYASCLLQAGDLVGAMEVVERSVGNRTVLDRLRPVAETIAMARHGPSWTNRYDYESRHYHVISDIDRETCARAATVLEEAWTVYNVRLANSKAETSQRFPVYLFSGKAGYDDYCKRILGSPVAHTAGLYTPVLKQLLIWNLTDREAMMRTVRHEGFHQFLDRIAVDAPVWFNEGMAEYYETLERNEKAVLVGGHLREDHLRTMRIIPPTSLAKFLRMGRTAFYANAQRNYAQAWAVIHFLRSDHERGSALFERLVSEILSGAPGPLAIETALSGCDLDALDRDFKDYWRSM